MTEVRRVRTGDLTAAEIAAIRAILWAAFAGDEDGAFTEDDWRHALGGVHVVGEADGAIVSHASVVERRLEVDGRPLRTGYVEAVATAPEVQGRGHGAAVIRAANAIVRDGYELGALGTGELSFYELLGWEVWRGATSVRMADGRMVRTPDEDGFIMILRTPTSPLLDLDDPISCEWRPGDAW